jgi:hypothetical protein
MTAWQRLHAATRELVTSAPIKNRLADAFFRHLQHVDATELPGSVRSDFIALRDDLHKVSPLKGETALQATIRKYSNEEAHAQALRIVDLWCAVLQAGVRHTEGVTLVERDALLEPRSADVVPLFAQEA